MADECGADALHHGSGEVGVASNDSRAGQRLALPELGSTTCEVTLELAQRQHERPGLSRGPQAHVHGVEPAHRAHRAERLDHALRQFREVIRIRSLLGGTRGERDAIAFVDEQQIEVTVVADLAAAEFTQAEDRIAARVPEALRHSPARLHAGLHEFDHLV